jgi:adenylate cyclase
MRDKIMPKEGLKRKLIAILSADVEGYSRLMGNDEANTIHTLTAYKEAMTNLINQNRGRVVDAPGDNLLADFVSVVHAVQCAVEIQQELAERNEGLPKDRKMVFRIGVNLGDVVEEEDRIYGDGVNIAARLESICEGGGVCISGTAFEHVENKLDFEFEDLGYHEVKNITNPVRVYRVQLRTEPKEKINVPHQKPSIAVLPFTNFSTIPARIT